MDPDFNWKFYLYANPDLKKDNINTKDDAEKHFLIYGNRENRKYKIEQKVDNFDSNIYYICNKHKYNNLNNPEESFFHYILYNNPKEEIIYNYENALKISNFNWIQYLYLNQYLLENNIDNEKDCFIHFLKNIKDYKNKENDNKIIINKYFDWRLYIFSYPDLINIQTYKNALSHYILFGINEKRFYWIGLTYQNILNISYDIIFGHFDNELYCKIYNLDNLSLSNIELYYNWIDKKKNIIKKNLLQKNNNIKEYSLIKPNFITFIIPTIGRESLNNTVNSLLKLQDTDWKAIIIFDGIKNTFSFNHPNIECIEIEKVGVINKDLHNYAGYVRNIGFKYVKDTEWIAFLDDDDYIHEMYITYLKKEINNCPTIDVCLFRMINIKLNVIPLKEDNQIIKNHCGISFAIRKKISKNIIFENDKCEDYIYLKKAEYYGFTIVLSNYITYYINIKTKYNKKISKIITKINEYNNSDNNSDNIVNTNDDDEVNNDNLDENILSIKNINNIKNLKRSYINL